MIGMTGWNDRKYDRRGEGGDAHTGREK